MTVGVDTLDRLQAPPIITYPAGDPPQNITTTSSTLGTVTAFQFWYYWPPSANHQANEWEPVYVYWDTGNPASPSLLAVETRFHFLWRQTGGGGLTLNGTQPVISFGIDLAGFRWHVPTVRPTGLLNLFKSPNQTISFPYTVPPLIPLTAAPWYYPLTNGGFHTLLLAIDPNSPPATGPTAYENDAAGNAGPVDPFQLYGTGRNFLLGITAGLGVVILVNLFLSLDIRILRKARRLRL